MTTDAISLNLPGRVAAPLAYSGWWITGALIWFLERRDLYVRFHAAQACVAFGIVALVVALLAGAAAASLMFVPNAFEVFAWAAGLSWVGGIVLWVVSIWHAATGRLWRIPIAGKIADRMCS